MRGWFSLFPLLARTSVMVHTRDGQTVAGVLVASYRDSLVLRHASYLLDSGAREQLVGDVVVPRENVSFLQVEGRPE